ncbi:MAG: hypothetical protein AAGI09_13955 [Pseudomonadota bacterium]
MKLSALMSCLVFAAMASVAQAKPITLTGLAIGDPNPAQVIAETTTNGDFLISDIGGNPGPSRLNDVTDEGTSWSNDLNAQLNGFVLSDVLSATLTLDAKTGGDAPATDRLFLDGKFISDPFGGPANFDSFTIELDLITLYGVDHILRAVNRDGIVNFGLGNDSTATRAVLRIEGNLAPVPLPASASLLLGAVALVGGTRVARQKRG